MSEPVVPSEYVAHVREVTTELRELIPRVAWIAGIGRGVDPLHAVAEGTALARQSDSDFVPAYNAALLSI